MYQVTVMHQGHQRKFWFGCQHKKILIFTEVEFWYEKWLLLRCRKHLLLARWRADCVAESKSVHYLHYKYYNTSWVKIMALLISGYFQGLPDFCFLQSLKNAAEYSCCGTPSRGLRVQGPLNNIMVCVSACCQIYVLLKSTNVILRIEVRQLRIDSS